MLNTFWKRLASATLSSEDLTEESRLLRTLLDNVPDVIYVKDLQSRFVLVNKALLDRHGLVDGNQVLGKSDIDLFGERGNVLRDQERELFRTGEAMLNVERHTHDKYGNPMKVLISKVPLRDADGHVIGLLGINRNITERMEAEQAIHDQHERFMVAADNSLSSFFILESLRDASGQIEDFVFTYINSRGEAMMRMSRDKVLGQRMCAIIPVRKVDGLFERYVNVVETRQTLEEEYCFTRADGSVSWRHHQVVPLGDGMVILSQDITARKLADEQLSYQANLIDSITDAIISTRRDYSIASWNAAAEALYGWTAEEAIGKNMLDLIIPAQWSDGEYKEREQRFVAAGYWQGEMLHRRRDGTTFPVMSSVSVVRDATGKLVGAVAVNRDVTERKQAEQQRLDLALERERVNMLRQFLGEVTHDLKNPLASIKLNLYMLERVRDDADRHALFANKIENQVERLEAMLDDLQTLSRLDQLEQTEEFHFAPLDVNELVEQILVEQEAVAAERGQSLSLNLTTPLPSILADSSKLYRAVANLVVNAIKYTGKDGQITVSTRADQQYVIIAVQDTGIGIAEKDLSHIFERFFQVDKLGKRGSGLGLAIARRIIMAHGGTITVESTTGVGSTFSVRLPCQTHM